MNKTEDTLKQIKLYNTESYGRVLNKYGEFHIRLQICLANRDTVIVNLNCEGIVYLFRTIYYKCNQEAQGGEIRYV